MGPRTPCPDQMHLRMYFHEPAYTVDAATVRAHLEECEVCRAIVAGIAAGDTTPDTLADEAGSSPWQAMPPAEGTVVFRMSETGSGLEDANEHPNTLADPAVGRGGRPRPPADDPRSQIRARRGAGNESQNTLSDQAVDLARGAGLFSDTVEFIRAGGGAEPQSAADTTVLLPAGGAASGDSLGFSDSSQDKSPNGNNDSTGTCFIPPAHDSRRLAASRLGRFVALARRRGRIDRQPGHAGGCDCAGL